MHELQTVCLGKRQYLPSTGSRTKGVSSFSEYTVVHSGCAVKIVKRITDGGADYSFECVGETAVINTALQSCCGGWGLTVTLGVPKSNPEVKAHFSTFLSGKTLKGSMFGGWKPKSDIPSLIQMYLNQEIQVDEYISHNMPLEDINQAFDLMKEGGCLRSVIHMPE
ncbi:S-(Hydroxymethyl)glutathione dehydrogenase [Heracleum sosnowskyi]|uniref:S-(Hydroxymethyl)glutathione dehydrogenase n=1 Tax=Heracleum sosnowskyi TaxID=360622 RepID=A0AAD8MM18_9APIA|nr:S-(Hydroxymethyl)glutathione dehydrogenase [Heracleum sosnowskyi]